MEDTRLTRESLNGQAYDRLCRDLKAGRYAPGEKLKLRDLGAKMGISPTPVREALARLISEQALEQIGHHSVRVPVMTAQRFDEVRDLRRMLEGEAAAHAASRAGPVDVARLQDIHDRMAMLRDRAGPGDAAAARLAAEHFHLGVYALADRPVLLRIIEGLWLQCGPLLKALDDHPLARSRKQHPHLSVLRGLRRGDAELARDGIRDEIERSTQPIVAFLRRQTGAAAGPARTRTGRQPA